MNGSLLDKKVYRHIKPLPKQSLYRAMRVRMQWTQRDAAAASSMKREQWLYRERQKVTYWLDEIVQLKEMGGLTWQEMGEMIEECM